MPSYQQLFGVQVTTKRISQIAAASNLLLTEFGMQPGGPLEAPGVGQRQLGWDIFNNVRSVPPGSVPGSAPVTVAPVPAGRVDVTVPRLNISLPIDYEAFGNLRVLGGPANVYDNLAADYIERQRSQLGQQVANWRALLLAGMIRGNLYAHVSGERIDYDFTNSNTLFNIDWQRPAGNKNQLNMLSAGNILDVPWSSPIANIPLHLQQIDVGFQTLVGSRLEVIMTTNAVWQYIINNDYVQAQAGTANTPFTIFSRTDEVMPNGERRTMTRAKLVCCPQYEFVITDEGFELSSGTYTPYLLANTAWFGPRPRDRRFFEMLTGAEPISDAPNQQPVMRRGFYAFTYDTFLPPRKHMVMYDNCIPAAYVPKATALGVVAGF